MRIRKFMIIGMLAIVIFPWFAYFFIHLLDAHPWQAQSHVPQANVTQTMQMISENQGEWTNPTWQAHLKSELSGEGLDVVIRSPKNQLIFQDVHHRDHHWMSNQQAMVFQDGKWVGTVQISEPGEVDPVAVIGALLAAILAIFFVGYQVGRNVISPLESMSRAALKIAEGDLDLELTTSKATEIRQVRSAFQVMVRGLREAFAKQQKLEEERRFFIGAIAHDLRTPLFSLRGYLDGMEAGIAASPEKLAHYIAVSREKAAHLERLVSDLFSFTRLEYMEQTLQHERFNLSEVVERTVASMARAASEDGMMLETRLPASACLVTGDPHLLERALTNLLDNALRFTPRGGMVTVDLQTEVDKVVLKIQDTGPGFSEEELAHIFDPMYRGDTSRNATTGGAGLGLTIARRVFRSHGGDLFAANATTGGAVLNGWIPVEQHGHEVAE